MQGPALVPSQASQRLLGLAALSFGLFQRGLGLRLFNAEALRITGRGDGETDRQGDNRQHGERGQTSGRSQGRVPPAPAP